MRTTFDLEDIIYQVLIASPALISTTATKLSGGIYKSGGRPLGSVAVKEDIVIGTLPVNNAQVQQAVMNINIHVPNLNLLIDNVQDKTKPDHVRLKVLTDLVIGLVDNKTISNYWFDVQQQHVFEEPGANEHYSNIRLNFYSENI